MKFSSCFTSFSVSVSLLLRAGVCARSIVPGATWTVENTGEHLQAHASGVLKVDDWYYLVGENKTYTSTNTIGNLFNSVSLYRSKDLATWEFVNHVLKPDTSIPDLNPTSIVERPKIIYNKTTGKYVLWFHSDRAGYGWARAGVAISDTIDGDYTYLNSTQPFGHASRDMGLFVDDDGTAYLMSENRDSLVTQIGYQRIYRLSEDYLSVEELVATITPNLECPAMIKKDGVYFLFGSYLTGWATNDNQYTTATSLSGPWSNQTTFSPVGTKTFNSQTSFILPVGHGAPYHADSFLFMGDRWNASGLWSSRYVWLPIDINTDLNAATGGNGAARLSWEDAFTIGTQTGEASTPTNTTIDVADATSSTGSVTFTNIDLSNRHTSYTLVFNYTNPTSNATYADISINGKEEGRMSFLISRSEASSVWQYYGVIGHPHGRLGKSSVSLQGSTIGNGTSILSLSVLEN